MLEAEDQSTPWQRVLWLKQPQYADNHLDESFLDNLRRNVNVRQYTYYGLVLDTMPVTQHVCSIAIFIAVFTQLYEKRLAWTTLLTVTLTTFLVGYSWWARMLPIGQSRKHHTRLLLTAFVLAAILYLLAPILQTLSKATTSDSIWPLSGLLFSVNTILADYSSGLGQRTRLPSPLSVNAAISASVVLSSRLEDELQVFVLMLFSIECFALFPILRKELLHSTSGMANISATIGLLTAAQVLFSAFSSTVAALNALAMLSLQLGIPLWLLRLQRLKNELRGPWDAAVPKIAPR